MMNLADLNPMQRRAAETLNGPVLILAGAGSGKTRTVTYRIANLISRGVNPRSILALTFTNKAAREMRERVEKLVGATAQDMWLGTFHSVCVRMLRRDIEKIGYSRSFTIYDDDDSIRVIKEALKTLNIDDKVISPREVSSKLSDAKNKLMNPDEWFHQSPRDFRSQKIHDIFVWYENKLKSANALDFDDILLKALQLLLDHPPVLDYYRRRFEYVHVDEYQDTNVAQYQFVRLLTQESRNLCVVGDDDQSIYGWRGADIRNILDFEKDFPDATVIKLEQNYRSTANILDAANQVIAHNRGRKEKALWTDAGEGEKIRLFAAGDEREEAAWICEQIRQMRRQQFPYSEMSVLYRMHAQSRVMEEMFMRAGIPYRVFGGTRFYDRREIKDALAYLRVIVNPTDDVSLLRIINTPRRSIGDSTVTLLQDYAREMDIPLYSAIMAPPDTLNARPRKCIGEFAMLLMKLTAMKDMMSLSEFCDHMLNETGLKGQFTGEDSEENKTRVENLMEFVGAAREFEGKSEEKTLEAFLENVALVTDLDRQEDAPQYVTMMTLHSAKGLEYKAVFLAGMEEGIFPSMRSVTEENRYEEERRLCYVGITRARERLFLSFARRRMLFNQITHNAPSPFLKEIPERLMQDEWASVRQNPVAADHLRQERPVEKNRINPARPRNLSFGTPGMGQQKRDPATIPGVTKGFVPSQAAKSANMVGQMYKVGERVLHLKFGKGTVRAIHGEGADARIRIAFTAYGEKEFSLAIAPIVKIED